MKKKVSAAAIRDKEAQQDDNHQDSSESLERDQTRVVVILRLAVLSVLLVTGALVSTGVYLYTRNDERTTFATNFESDARQVIDSFHSMVERNLGAVASLSTTITSHALQSNQTFPFVTVPDFELRGSHARAQSGSHVIHFMPLVVDDKRREWEEYTLENRQHIDKAFQNDMVFRTLQDDQFAGHKNDRYLQQQQQQQQEALNMTILEDGTGFHPKIWRAGGAVSSGDEPEGSGPFLPLWQRSPIDGAKQATLNMNFANTRALRRDIIESMTRDKKAVLNSVAVPIPEIKERLEANLRLSQYREHVDVYIDGLSTFLAYPIFDSFSQEEKQVAGVLATNIYWDVLFSGLHLPYSDGVLVVVENSFNQTFTYRIDNHDAVFLSMGDVHDTSYDDMEISAEVTEYLEARAGPVTRAYATVPLSNDTQYKIRVFPTQATEDLYITNHPVIYTTVVLCGFAFASLLFLGFSYVVERRQKAMVKKVIQNANRAAIAERELNEFLSHEVRNPLSAAMSACSFVSSAVNELDPLADSETRRNVREDIEVVSSSLHFINDFLRSMLDIHRAKITVAMVPTDILRDVLEPVSTILYKRVASFDIQIVCPENLVVMTDPLRLKQVILNLVRNASKFVERGFLRMRADVVDDHVRLYVEDSGPGISPEKQRELFAKYQASLDLLSQGTGLGLSLSKKLMDTMNGEIWLDGSYLSGVDSCPGARFVVQLNTPPLDMDGTLPTENSESEFRQVSYTVLGSGSTNSVLPDGCCSDNADHVAKKTELQVPFGEPLSPQSAIAAELPSELSVLFVDDDMVLRKLFIRAVKKLCPNWKIQEASSGETAIRLCESESFDLIFLDQYMASMDKQLLGTETAQSMRLKGIKSKICGLSANDLRGAFINAGADEFMLKPMPCKPDDLKRVLSGILSEERKPLDLYCA